jgi:Fe-S cluster biogenesis protein NfuA
MLPRLGYNALRLIAVPYVHFEGACSHCGVVKALASAIVVGGGVS